MDDRDYTMYLLRDEADIKPNIAKVGTIAFSKILNNIEKLLEKMPGDGSDVKFLTCIPERIIPFYIQCVCYYLNHRPFNPFDYVVFNNKANRLRRFRNLTPREEAKEFLRVNNINISEDEN